MSKPVLTFVKMMGCGPCNNFFGNPQPEKSQWAQLVKDPELNKIVDFSLTEWGFDKVTGEQYKKPTHLNFVQYGPAFVLVDSAHKETHLEYNKNSPKTAADIKRWVLENHKKLRSVSAPVTATKVPPAKKPGAPLAFVANDKLPRQLQGHVKPQDAPRKTPIVVRQPVPPPQLQVQQPVVAKKEVKTGSAGLRIVPRNTKLVGRRR